jgi:hypothetical protein
MLKFDIVDHMIDASKMENAAMRLRCPAEGDESNQVFNGVDSTIQQSPNTFTEQVKPNQENPINMEQLSNIHHHPKKTRLEQLLEEYKDTPTSDEAVVKSKPRQEFMLNKMKLHNPNEGRGGKSKGMEIVTDMSEIDKLDEGKPWHRLDNWTRKSKLQEYAGRKSLEDDVSLEIMVEELLEKYRQGRYRKKSEVEYDIQTNQIVRIIEAYGVRLV